MQRKKGFTLIELLVVISIIALLIGILLPALGSARRNARQMQSSTQVRGIIQGMVNFSPGNNEWYPGLSGTGGADTTTLAKSTTLAGTATANGFFPEYRYVLMIRNSYFSPEYAISPSESDANIKDPVKVNVDMADKHYSYAMLCLNTGTGSRIKEWKQTTNSKAVTMSDRNIGDGTGVGAGTGNAQAIHDANGSWRGTVGYNDNHVNFETTQIIKDTVYSQQAQVSLDSLFIANADVATKSGNDALMTYKFADDDDSQVSQKPSP